MNYFNYLFDRIERGARELDDEQLRDQARNSRSDDPLKDFPDSVAGDPAEEG